MTKRFNYKQFEMQMEDLTQEVSRRCVLSKQYAVGSHLIKVHTRNACIDIFITAKADYDEEDAVAVMRALCLWVELGDHVIYDCWATNHEAIRGHLPLIIKAVRNQPEQIRWMEQRILESCVTDNGITTKTRRL